MSIIDATVVAVNSFKDITITTWSGNAVELSIAGDDGHFAEAMLDEARARAVAAALLAPWDKS